MPIYPYLCNDCGHEFDRLQKISDDPLKVCPECGAESLRKKLTAASFQLKGTGWYETDFKDKDKKGDKKGGETQAATRGVDWKGRQEQAEEPGQRRAGEESDHGGTTHRNSGT